MRRAVWSRGPQTDAGGGVEGEREREARNAGAGKLARKRIKPLTQRLYQLRRIHGRIKRLTDLPEGKSHLSLAGSAQSTNFSRPVA